MEKKQKILTIGDIHGRDYWKFITHGSSYEFEQWVTMVNAGANPMDDLFKEDYPYFSADKIVFVGDYVDSFTISNVEIKKNLEDIIFFKKTLPNKVVLLWGNHDVQYFIPNQICSGYRPEARWDLQILFESNKDLFQMAYHEGDYLWTHAGLLKPVLSVAASADRTLPHNILTLTAEQGNAPYGPFGGAILFKNRSYCLIC